MKLNRFFAAALIGVLAIGGSAISSAQSLSPSTKWHWDKGTIVVDTPQARGRTAACFGPDCA